MEKSMTDYEGIEGRLTGADFPRPLRDYKHMEQSAIDRRRQLIAERSSRESKWLSVMFAVLVIIGWLVLIFADKIDGRPFN